MSTRTRLKRTLAVLGLLIPAVIADASRPVIAAEPNKDAVMAAMRTLNFVSLPAGSSVEAAITYDPSSDQSRSQAIALEGMLGSELRAGRIMIRVQKIPVTELQKATGLAVIILTDDLDAHFDKIERKAISGKILNVSFGMKCVEMKKCTMGVQTQPNVEIFVSEEAAASAGINFSAAFLLMANVL